MTLLEQFIDCLKRGDNVGMADLFDDNGVLHDASWRRIGYDTVHLCGKMAVEMMFHHKFGMNRGPFTVSGVKFTDDNVAWYFIVYNGVTVPVVAYLSSVTEDGKIDRLNILAM